VFLKFFRSTSENFDDTNKGRSVVVRLSKEEESLNPFHNFYDHPEDDLDLSNAELVKSTDDIRVTGNNFDISRTTESHIDLVNLKRHVSQGLVRSDSH